MGNAHNKLLIAWASEKVLAAIGATSGLPVRFLKIVVICFTGLFAMPISNLAASDTQCQKFRRSLK